LDAVRNGRFYRLNEDWLREDPISMAGQVMDALKIIPASAASGWPFGLQTVLVYLPESHIRFAYNMMGLEL